MAGIDKILEFIFSLLNDLLPFYVVKVFQCACVLRFGKFHSIKGAGFHWKIPFVDDPNIYNTVTTTIKTPVQSFSTSDDIEVSVTAVIKYNISDVQLHTEAIYDATDAIIDMTQGCIVVEVEAHTYKECQLTSVLSKTLTKNVRAEVKKYGIYVEKLTITDFSKAYNLRLFNDNAN